MSDKIEPALTPEEWADEKMWNASPDPEMIGHGEEGPKGLHRIAARALHGQPFGFTRDDVDRLRKAHPFTMTFPDGTEVAGVQLDWVTAEQVADLADRIEALLPPRDKPTP